VVIGVPSPRFVKSDFQIRLRRERKWTREAGTGPCRKIVFKGIAKASPNPKNPIRIRMFPFLYRFQLLRNSPWRRYFLG